MTIPALIFFEPDNESIVALPTQVKRRRPSLIETSNMSQSKRPASSSPSSTLTAAASVPHKRVATHNQIGDGATLIQGDVNHHYGSASASNPRDSHEEFLRKFSTTDPRLDKKRIERQKGDLFPASYQWILDNEQFLQWRDGDDNHMLWIRGDPGKGKTMLLCGIIDELSRQNTDQVNIVYFFCQASDDRLNHAHAVLRGLIWSLLTCQRSLKLPSVYQNQISDDALSREVNSWDALTGILDSLLKDPCLHATYLIIDALDECTQDHKLLLHFLAHQTPSRTRLLVSSRNWPSIENGLHEACDKRSLSLELNATSVANAVHVFIEHKVAKLSSAKQFKPATEELVKRVLESKANDTFLWVSMVCQALDDIEVRSWHAQEMMDSFPVGLQQLYNRMLSSIIASRDSNLLRQVLSLMTLVYRPLHIEELALLVEDQCEFPDDLDDLRELVGACGSFLCMRENQIYFVHQSAKDFLLNSEWNMNRSIFPKGISFQHRIIAERSLQALAGCLCRDICNFNNDMITKEEVPEGISRIFPSQIRYACRYWADHCVGDAEAPTLSHMKDDGTVHRFLKKHLLHWLEAMSILNDTWYAIASILKLHEFVQQHASSTETELENFLYDAQRFMRHNKDSIDQFPLQVYVEALLFTPERSMVRKAFHHDIEGMKVRMETSFQYTDWSPCILTMRSSIGSFTARPVHFAVSEDGNKAMVQCGRKIEVWHTKTGQRERTWECPRDVISGREYIAELSDDAKRVAYGISEGVHVFDLETNQAWALVFHAPSYIHQMAISRDGQMVALVLGHHSAPEFRIWNVTTGEESGFPTESSEKMVSLALSPDGQWLAALYRRRIKFWNMVTGEERHFDLEFKHMSLRFNIPTYLVFSPDGRFVALNCEDRVHVWETSTFALRLRLNGPDGKTGDLSFSGDSLYMALQVVVHSSAKVKIWKLSNLPEISEIEIPEREIPEREIPEREIPETYLFDGLPPSVCCLLDRRNILCKYTDDWTVYDTSLLETAKSHAEGSVAQSPALERQGLGLEPSVSPDGRQILSCFRDGFFYIDEVENARLKRKATGSRIVNMGENFVQNKSSGSFSRDGKMVAFALERGIVSLHNADTGQFVAILEPEVETGVFERFSSFLTWSLDGKKIALKQYQYAREPIEIREYIILWDTTTYNCLWTHRAQKGGPWVPRSDYSFYFSPDGEKLVLPASGGNGLRVLNATTGRCLWSTDDQCQQCTPDEYTRDLLFSPDGKYLMNVAYSGCFHILTTESGRRVYGACGGFRLPMQVSWHSLDANSTYFRTQEGFMRLPIGTNDLSRGGFDVLRPSQPLENVELKGIGLGRLEGRRVILRNGKPVMSLPQELEYDNFRVLEDRVLCISTNSPVKVWMFRL